MGVYRLSTAISFRKACLEKYLWTYINGEWRHRYHDEIICTHSLKDQGAEDEVVCTLNIHPQSVYSQSLITGMD